MTAPVVTGECHPACAILPPLGDAEFAALVEDIRENGQRHPIIVDDAGVILDGRNRWCACQTLGIEPQVRDFKGDEAAKSALIPSENLHRRHMSKGQRAMAVALLRPEPKMGRGSDEAKVATQSGVSADYLRRARALLAWSEDAAKTVLAGHIPLSEAYRQMLDERQLEGRAPPPPSQQHDMPLKARAVDGEVLSTEPEPDEPDALPQETAAEVVARVADPPEPERRKQRLSAPQRMRHRWNALQKERAQQQGEQESPAAPGAAPDWRVGIDACRQAYLTAACELGRERRIKECERVLRALDLPIGKWRRIALPEPEAGAKWPDDGSFIRQMVDFGTRLLDLDSVSPSAVQMLGERLLTLGRARIGAPVAASQTGESDALATENMDALRERAMRLDAEAVAQWSGIGLDKIGRFLAGKALSYHDVPKLKAALDSLARAERGEDT
jgi:ParB-like chromosome segregation protein Spo0J